MEFPSISDAEWRVMKTVWSKSPRTAHEIISALDDTEWSPPTIRTLIGRLVKKGAVGYEKSGREYLYSALVDEEECIHSKRRSFIRRVYGGAVQPMFAHLLEDEELTPEELDALRELLKEKRRKLS
jgi:BlaI family penicillinase repressor